MSGAMTFSLWRGDELLGHAQLSEVTNLSVRAVVMSGPFVPTVAFADVWPTFQVWNRCGAELNSGIGSITVPDMSPEAFRAQLFALVPDALFRASREAELAVSALGLELRDEAGQVVPDASVQVDHLDLLSSVAHSQNALAEAKAEAARQGITVSRYIMVVTRAHSGTPPAERSQANVIPPAF
jgi:hypothetical protein